MKNKKINYAYLLFISIVAALGGGLFGFDTAVISGTIQDVKSIFGFSSILEGWFVSSALVGCVIGVIFAGKLSDSFGRKRILILSSILFLISAIGCMFSITGEILIVFRMLGGIGVGMASILSPLFISEISPTEIRGRMVTLYQLAITIGILLAYFSNTLIVYLSNEINFSTSLFSWIINDEKWRVMFGAETVPAIIFLVSIFLIPKSPRWLIAKGKDNEAKKILQKINPTQYSEEFTKIQQTITVEESKISELLKPGLRKALFIGLFLAILSQFSGINVIIYYGPKILGEAGFAEGQAISSQVLIGIINVVFTLVAIWKIDSFGRKPLLLFGIGGCILSHLIISILFMISATGYIVVFFLALFIASFAFSLGPITWVIISEIYPTKIRGRAMAIATVSLWIANAIVGQIFPIMLENLKAVGTFLTFSMILIPAFYLVWKFVPETKNKSLEEIEGFWK